MPMVGLLAWPTSCRGFGCAAAADIVEVPGVDHDVEEYITVDPALKTHPVLFCLE